MRHGVMCQGGYDANVRSLVPGGRTYIADGGVVVLPDWPESVDGIRFGALERRGRLLVMRVAFSDQEVILRHPVILDSLRHLDGAYRPDAAAALLSDELAERLLDDILDVNPSQANAIALVVNRVNQVRRASREAAARPKTSPGTGGASRG